MEKEKEEREEIELARLLSEKEHKERQESEEREKNEKDEIERLWLLSLQSLSPRELLSETDKLNNEGLYAVAEKGLSKLLLQLLGLSPIDLDQSLLSSVQLLLGFTKLYLAKYSEAKDLFNESKSIRVSFFSQNSLPVAEVLEGLALCARIEAEYKEASRYYNEVFYMYFICILYVFYHVQFMMCIFGLFYDVHLLCILQCILKCILDVYYS